MNNRYGVIDMGTNTFHLLIIEVDQEGIHQLYKEKRPVKIGQGGITKGIITDDALQRGVQTLKDFSQKLTDYNVIDYKAIATSAFRSASNKSHIIEEIKRQTSITVHLVDGDHEAQLIYEGVKQAITLDVNDRYLIIDIGGGSVEYIICDHQSVLWKQSYEIGGQRLMEEFHQTDPISSQNLENLHRHILTETIGLHEAISNYKPNILIGASGTFDTLVEIYHKRNNMLFVLDSKTEYKLPISDFYTIHNDLVSKNRKELLLIPGMISMRVDMIVVAISIVKNLTDHHPFDLIKASTYALKEGVINRMVSEINY